MIKLLSNYKTFAVVLLLLIVVFASIPGAVSAQMYNDPLPAVPCGVDGDGNPVQVEINLNCQRARILNPQSDAAQTCFLYLCPDTNVANVETIDVRVFFVSFRLNSEAAVGQVLFIIFSLVLGFIVLAMMGYGIYGAYKRAQADSPDEIAASQKILTNAIIGFLIVGLSLLIIQVFASLIGLGSINDLVDFGPALP